jgi:DNA-binding response OmpR family regulator
MNSNLTSLFSDSEFQGIGVSPGASMRPVLSKKILLVEDEKAVRETIQEFLNRNGYKVSSAPDGLEAVDKLAKEEYDLVITDLAMPKMDGFGLMSQSLKIQPLTPIIILSGQGTFENALRAIQMGAYDFVTKPIIDFAAFKLRLDNGLERKSFLLMEKSYQRDLEKLVASQTQELIEKNDMLQDYAIRLEDTSVSFISALQMALEEKNKYTAGHSRLVTEFSVGIGEKLGLGEKANSGYCLPRPSSMTSES